MRYSGSKDSGVAGSRFQSDTQTNQLSKDLAKMICFQLLLVVAALCYSLAELSSNDIKTNIPIVVTTWKFKNASTTAWDILAGGGSAIEAIEKGCQQCEIEQCAGTVGYGGSPDENGETTQDALIMDGNTMNVGAVGALRGIRNAVSVARAVLEHTGHTLLVGDQATEFAIQMGFKRESTSTNVSMAKHQRWKRANCQPNFWLNVSPDPKTNCGPYKPIKPTPRATTSAIDVSNSNHDTIGMVAIDKDNRIVAGTSTNGLRYKIAGRVGDSPIPGSGAYADSEVGGATGTGDGDIMMRFVPSFLAVDEMRRGATPSQAADTAIRRMLAHYPTFSGAVIALSKNGEYGAACNNLPLFNNTFPFYVRKGNSSASTEQQVNCI